MKKLNKAFDIEFSDSNCNQGWSYGGPVGIKTVQWPRSRVNGLPMAHIWTFLVPEEYRVKGENYVAISLFQADDHVADAVEGVSNVINDKKEIKNPNTQIFWDSLLEYAENKHPMEIYLKDIIGGGWALIWLTQEEFNSNLTEIPNEDETTFTNYDKSNGTSCFKQNEPPKYVKLTTRENDPNIGRKLEGYPDKKDKTAYINMYSVEGKKLNLEEKFFGKTHFGGTANPIQGVPEFSPFYIEFEENFGNSNMGGGNGQIDLLNDELDWACG